MGSKEKILQYIDYKGISIYKFEKIVGISNGSLKSGKDFGVDKIPLIRDNCPDLNMDWLIYDEGNMLLEGNSTLQEGEDNYEKGLTIDEKIQIQVKKAVSEHTKTLNQKLEVVKGLSEIDFELLQSLIKLMSKKVPQ